MFKSRFLQNSQIAAVQDLFTGLPGPYYQFLKMGIHLRGPPSDVNRFYTGTVIYDFKAAIYGFLPLHHLGAQGRGFYVAMMTGLIAFLPHINLQGGDPQGFKRGGLQGLNYFWGKRDRVFSPAWVNCCEAFIKYSHYK